MPDVHLWLYGANMDVLPPDTRESLVEAMRTAAADGNVTLAGAYDHAAVPQLMAEVDWIVVPSRWWENSPLVIQEAFMHGRPVICSDIGGMKEKVTNGVNGLHFVVSNPGHLAQTITNAVTTPGLWQKLREGIPPAFTMDEHMDNLARMYNELLERRAPPVPAPELIPTAG
jgi:glycosyltransferase involved in cell wall biosynthesis